NNTYQVRIIGVPLNSSLLNISKGNIKDLHSNNSVFIEENTDEKYDTNLQIGDELEIFFSTNQGGKAANLTVKGFVDAPWAVPYQQYPEVIFGFMGIKALQQLLNLTGKIMYVQIYVKSGYNTTEVFERVKTYIELHYNITVEGYVHSTKGGIFVKRW
ncbi:MAG: hypothetical protein ACTSSP_11805, partial [Candidatus Asgardarchaeia archaeon]